MASIEDQKRNDPSTLSHAYEAMAGKWCMINDLMGGTETMRAAKQRYLPQHPHEKQENYDLRLAVSTLFNMFELTLDSLVGKPFSEPVKVNEDTPEPVKALMDDVDLQGNGIHTFARHWFREGVAKGYAHCLIDYPRIEKIDGRARTLLDDERDENRPYWVLIRPENVIAMNYTKIRGRNVLTHARMFETRMERDGFSEVPVTTIKVLEPGRWYIYTPKKDRGRKVVWTLTDSGLTDIDFVPMVTFHTSVDEHLVCKPPLEDLAYLNIRHWQSSADQNNILTVARFPMLAVSGAYDNPTDGKMAIGPRQLLVTRQENGKFYYVEHSGAAINSGKEDIEKLEQDMAAYGAEFLRKRPGGTTATSRALDSAEATSPLQDMAIRFNDCVNMAMSMTAEWLGLGDDGGSVRIETDFGPDEITDVDIRGLLEARRNRDLSRKDFIEELRRRGLIRDDFDHQKNVDELMTEEEIESPFATGRNTDGSGAANVENETRKARATRTKKKVA